MCNVVIKGNKFQMALTFDPSADFIGCLLTGVMAALPAFLDAFMRCLAGGEGSGKFNPGDRARCSGG